MEGRRLRIMQENWEKVARGAGDYNPIHSSNSEDCGYSRPFCAGLYLFALAEKTLRNMGEFNLPLLIKTQFKEYLVNNDFVIIEPSEGRLVFRKEESSSGRVVGPAAILSYEDLEPDFQNDSFGESDIEREVREITQEDLELFNQGLDITDNREVYSSFVIGSIINRFLEGGDSKRYGTILTDMEARIYQKPVLGDFEISLDVDEKIRRVKRKEIRDYDVKGKCYQGGILVGEGNGNGIHIVRHKNR